MIIGQIYEKIIFLATRGLEILYVRLCVVCLSTFWARSNGHSPNLLDLYRIKLQDILRWNIWSITLITRDICHFWGERRHFSEFFFCSPNSKTSKESIKSVKNGSRPLFKALNRIKMRQLPIVKKYSEKCTSPGNIFFLFLANVAKRPEKWSKMFK